MRCFLEINTGSGEYTKVLDFGYYPPQMQALLALLDNPNLLNEYNGAGAEKTGSVVLGTIDQLRSRINIANAQQQAGYDSTIKYLTGIHEAGLVHPACTFRSIAPTFETTQLP
jgi:hypothetical protein